MDDHSGGLVDDEQMLVLVRDPQNARLRLQRAVVSLGGLQLQQLAADEPMALRTRLAVYAYRAARK
jgi:hypothetical protein